MRMFSTDNKKSGFFDFLKKDEPAAEATQETPAEQNDDVKFDGKELSGLEADQDVVEAAEQSFETLEDASEEELFEQPSEIELYLKQAVTKYNLEFFKRFQSTGRDAHKHTQKKLEEHILSMTDN